MRRPARPGAAPALALTAVAGCLLALLAGCPVTGDRTAPEHTTGAPQPSTSQPTPALPTRASVDRPAYAGPPADAPPTTGPIRTLRAAVDLSPATPGIFCIAGAAVAAPDGRVLVLLSTVGHHPSWIATVGPVPGGWGVTASVGLPQFTEVAGLHLLPDGSVVVVGQLRGPDGGGRDVGFAVVEPATGAARTQVAVPLDDGVLPVLRSALSVDGHTLDLLVTSVGAQTVPEQLVALDVGSGRITARRDLAGDVAAVSLERISFEAVALLARPAGGVTLVFDASPTGRVEGIPTLLPFDANLAPDGDAVRLTDLAEDAETGAVTIGADGTVFAVVAVGNESWVLAVPSGGGAGPVLAVLPDPAHDFALVVEPAQVWALLPSPVGARAVDLRTGEVQPSLDLGCRDSLHVRGVVAGGPGAVLFGECDLPSVRTAMLWLAGA